MSLTLVASDVLLAVAISLCALAALVTARRALWRGRGSQMRAWLYLLLALSSLLGLAHYADERQQREQAAVDQIVEQGLGVAWKPARPQWFWLGMTRLTGREYRHAVALSTELKSNWAHSDEARRIDAGRLHCIGQLHWLQSVELPYYQQHGGPFVAPRADVSLVASLGGLRRLEQLDLSGQPVGDDCLPHLLRLTRLRRLDLTGTRLSGSACAELRSAMPDATLFEP